MNRLNLETEKKGKNGYLDFLSKIFEPEKPLAKMIRTPTASGYHLYDTGTNRILQCRKEVFELVQNLLCQDVDESIEAFISRHGEKKFLDAAEDIVNAVNEENILQVKKASGFGLSDHFENVEDILNSTVQSISLELTQDCGLRCQYCVYNCYAKGQRDHGSKVMSFDAARKAIDFLKAHSSKNDLVAIGTYGGEPLLRFPFMKKCVQYARKVIDKQEIMFNITTNATLINEEIAEFLLKEGFSILVSLDGPAVFHDRYRTDKHGKGSFDKTLKGLKILAEKYHKIQEGHISVNVVYAPPFSEAKLNAISDFFKGLEWLPEIHIMTAYPTEGTIPANLVQENGLNEEKDLWQWAFEKYRVDLDKSDTMVKGIMGKLFARLMQRSVYTVPVDNFYLNGCCVPGQKKNHVTVDGSIHICERISTHAPAIGHVDTGFDFEIIKKVYIDDYAKKSLKDCSGCWGLRLCDICYYLAFNAEGELDMEKKRKYCGYQLMNLERILGYFISLQEENPGKLDYLYQYDIK